MALIEPINEKAFKKLSKRLLQVLKAQNPAADPAPTLEFAQETLCKISGWGSVHALRQQWSTASAVTHGEGKTSSGTGPIEEASQADDLLQVKAINPPSAGEDQQPDLDDSTDEPEVVLDTTWTPEHEAAWQALPRLYRRRSRENAEEVPLAELRERQVRLRGWRTSDVLWREGIVAHEEMPSSDFIAWAKARPEAANALGWWPGDMPRAVDWDQDSMSGYFAYPPKMWLLQERFLHRDFDLYERLVREAQWPNFLNMRQCDYHDQDHIEFLINLWSHPHKARLMGLVPDDQLPQLIRCLASNVSGAGLSIQDNRYVPYVQRREKITPLMDLLASRVEAADNPQVQMCWEALLAEVHVLFHGYHVSFEHAIRGQPQFQRPNMSVPTIFRFLNGGGGAEAFREWGIQDLYAAQSPEWKEALTLLDHRPKTLPAWTAWLQTQGPSAAALTGALANRPGGGVRLGYVVRDVGGEYYEAWLKTGLPPAMGEGATGWRALASEPLFEGP